MRVTVHTCVSFCDESQHWGYVLTERDSDAYVKSKGGKLPQLPRPRKRNTDDAGAAKKRTKK